MKLIDNSDIDVVSSAVDCDGSDKTFVIQAAAFGAAGVTIEASGDGGTTYIPLATAYTANKVVTFSGLKTGMKVRANQGSSDGSTNNVSVFVY